MDCLHEEEKWTRDEINKAQLVRLQNTVEQALKAPYYAKKLKEAKINASTIKSLDDLKKIPFTTKDDLRAGYPDAFLATPRSEIVRLHASSGTTGTPTVICHTQDDINSWADLMARCMYMVGIRREDSFQNMAGYGLFTGGLGIHYGAERLGCMTIPAGAGNTRRQLKFIQDFKVKAVHILPSYALHIGEKLKEDGFDPRELPAKIALIGAEPHTEEARQRIEHLLGLRAFNSYGLSEMNGPGVAFECIAQNGLHVWEDAYIVEIIDPKTLEPVKDGEIGELVFTTLCRKGMPILRYRTRDLSRFINGSCVCGREHRRIDRILGRSDDMLIIKGCNFYPMQVEQVLLSFPQVGQNYVLELIKEGSIDQLQVKVEINPAFFEEEKKEDMRVLHQLQRNIAERLKDELLFTPKVDLVEANSLPKSEGKAIRVVDKRKD
ncbi:phenylacetate--CoA ligase family protein [Desulfovibrio litoralis]|uniref:Phenylacetate-coenzyme A ligase n=1 Tax=Desulfovibrio litoralis DSM 11393 TaxID=1121455 RepID=A0A1M7T8Z4_9BACT|nr:phenylacetate--CoA ligase [Desulfovibrio litoralis]SHN67153.1 phenylacetate-CoA ligase [Desulfovibrio litoralis DSM 11393]